MQEFNLDSINRFYNPKCKVHIIRDVVFMCICTYLYNLQFVVCVLFIAYAQQFTLNPFKNFAIRSPINDFEIFTGLLQSYI